MSKSLQAYVGLYVFNKPFSTVVRHWAAVAYGDQVGQVFTVHHK